ncbi:MAG: phosphotransferase [Chloroflexota bacterium]
MLTSEINHWIIQQLEAQQLSLTAPVKIIHKRAWSIVAQVPTTSGIFYLKATTPELRYEVGLTAILSKMEFPVPKIVAVDEANGWLLMHDGGPSLRSILQETQDISLWETAVSQYVHMQRQLIDKTDMLLQTGLFDRRLSELPRLYEELLQDKEAMLIGQENGLSEDEFQALLNHIPTFKMLCQQLADFGIPETLHHDDLHDNNIFVRDDQLTIADWGETCVAHPFFSMIIVLRISEYIFEFTPHHPALNNIKDVYLRHWIAFGTLKQLNDAFRLAQLVGTINRALTWHHLLAHMKEPERMEEAGSVLGWLNEFLELVNAS